MDGLISAWNASPIAQIIGLAAFVIVVASFQSNKRGRILALLCSAQVLFSIHFGMLGAWTAMAMNIIAAVRTYVFSYKDKKRWAKHNAWPAAFAGLFTLVGTTIAWEDYYSLLPILAMVLETAAIWSDKPRRIRHIIIFTKPLWFTYNYIVGSWAGMLTEIFVFASIVIAMLRYDINLKFKRNNPKNPGLPERR